MRSIYSLLSIAMLAGLSSSSGSAVADPVNPTGPRPDPGLPIRFKHAHGTASEGWYGSTPGSRQRKRRKAARQGGR